MAELSHTLRQETEQKSKMDMKRTRQSDIQEEYNSDFIISHHILFTNTTLQTKHRHNHACRQTSLWLDDAPRTSLPAHVTTVVRFSGLSYPRILVAVNAADYERWRHIITNLNTENEERGLIPTDLNLDSTEPGPQEIHIFFAADREAVPLDDCPTAP